MRRLTKHSRSRRGDPSPFDRLKQHDEYQEPDQPTSVVLPSCNPVFEHSPRAKNMLIGYVRVSSDDQHLYMQRDALEKAEC